MAYLPRIQECKNGCGASIYFDRDSKVSHPSQDKWVPLEYNEDTGVYTGEKHNCPKYSNGGGSNGHNIKQQQQPQQHQQQTIKELKQVAASTTETTDLLLQIKLLQSKMDKVISLLEDRLPVAGVVLKDD